MLGRSVAERLSAGVWSEELVALCRGCDAVVANLECCVSDRGSPTTLIPGKPFFFRSPPEGVDALLEIGTTVAGLANNHALDFGPDALADTVAHLEGARIEPAGVERRGVLVAAGDLTLGVLAMSDHPAEYSSGIAFADLRRALPDWVRAELERLRAAADFVLAFPHWGPNMTASPARWQRRRAVELIDAGRTSSPVIRRTSSTASSGSRAGSPSTTSATPWTTTRSTASFATTSGCWRSGGRTEARASSSWGLSLDFATRGWRRAPTPTGSPHASRACEELGTAVERTGEARFVVSARSPWPPGGPPGPAVTRRLSVTGLCALAALAAGPATSPAYPRPKKDPAVPSLNTRRPAAPRAPSGARSRPSVSTAAHGAPVGVDDPSLDVCPSACRWASG